MPQKKVKTENLPEKTQKLLEYHNNAPEWDGKKTQCSGYTTKNVQCKTTTQGRRYCWKHSPQNKELTDQAKEDYLTNFRQCLQVGQALNMTGKGRLWLDNATRTDADFANALEHLKHSRTEQLEATATERALGWKEDVFDREGNVVGVKHVYSDRLMEFLLKAQKPETYRESYNVNIGKQRESNEADIIAQLMQPGAFEAVNNALTPQLVEAERVDDEEGV